MAHAPFAEYRLVCAPEGIPVRMPLAPGVAVLTEGKPCVVGRVPDVEVFVDGGGNVDWRAPPRPGELPGWGGRRNHALRFSAGRWRLEHLGHSGYLKRNGVFLEGRAWELLHADRVEPAVGLCFSFLLRPDLEAFVAALGRVAWTAASSQVLADGLRERLALDDEETAIALSHLRARLELA